MAIQAARERSLRPGRSHGRTGADEGRMPDQQTRPRRRRDPAPTILWPSLAHNNFAAGMATCNPSSGKSGDSGDSGDSSDSGNARCGDARHRGRLAPGDEPAPRPVRLVDGRVLGPEAQVSAREQVEVGRENRDDEARW